PPARFSRPQLSFSRAPSGRLLAAFLAELACRRVVDAEPLGIAIRVSYHHDAVVALRRGYRHVLVAHVLLHALRVALERIPPAPAAVRQIAEGRARPCLPDGHAREVEVLALVGDRVGRRIEHPGDRLRLRVHVPLGPDRLRRRALLTRIEDPGGAAAAIGAAVDAHA